MDAAIGQTTAQFKEFTALLEERMGLYFPQESWPDLEKKLKPLVHSRGFTDINRCLTWLISSLQQNKQIADLAHYLTVGETAFFRDDQLFALLEEQLLPSILERRRHDRQLRIWSAGCSTGEEAYSLALVLHKILPDRQDWNIHLLATDINPYFLNKAAKGRYSQRQVSCVKKNDLQTCFTPHQDGTFTLKSEIKNLVTFAHHNLVARGPKGHSPSFNDMDLILCHHVLTDFSPNQARCTIDRLADSLREGGWLSVAAAEVPLITSSVLIKHHFRGVVCFEKNHSPSESLEKKPQQVEKTPVQKDLLQNRLAQLKRRPQALKHRTKEAALLVRQLIARGEFAQALDGCEAILAIEKLDPDLHYLHAEVHSALGNILEAIKSSKRAIFLNPEFVAAHYLLGQLEAKRGRDANAKKQFKITLGFLKTYRPNARLPGTTDLTADRVREIITKFAL